MIWKDKKEHNYLIYFRIGPKLGLNTRGPGMFPVPDWNHFEDIISGLAQTNNTSEGKKCFYYSTFLDTFGGLSLSMLESARTYSHLFGRPFFIPVCPFMLKMFLICGCGQDAVMNVPKI
jgi:hypothetical protein